MDSSFALGIAVALAAGLLFGYGAIIQARTARSQPDSSDDLVSFVLTSLRDPQVLLVVAMYLVGFGFHALAIDLLPLYLAQAGIALSLPVTALFAGQLSERLGAGAWAGVAAVCSGLVLLAISAGGLGPSQVLATDVAALWAGLIALAIATQVGDHPLWLGLVGGLGYAICAIAVRLTVSSESQAVMLIAAAAVPISGVLGFWSYSRALGAEQVTTATAPLVAAETFVPALAGVFWLGDQIRDDWWAGVIVGLVLCVCGSLALAKDAHSVPADLRPVQTS